MTKSRQCFCACECEQSEPCCTQVQGFMSFRALMLLRWLIRTISCTVHEPWFFFYSAELRKILIQRLSQVKFYSRTEKCKQHKTKNDTVHFFSSHTPAITIPPATTTLGTRYLFPFTCHSCTFHTHVWVWACTALKVKKRIRKMLPSSRRVNRHVISINVLVRREEKHRLCISNRN